MPNPPLKDWMKLIPETDLAAYRAGDFLRVCCPVAAA
jgi:hypothetical protein